MSKHTHVWTWPIAGYLFLGGLGAGMIIVAAVADLFLDLSFLFIPCALGSLVALGLGSFLLIFELGRPFQFWRVFSKEKAILTFGAWMVIALILFDIVYLSCWFGVVPWYGVVLLRQVIAVICLLLGCGVLLYTGIELASMKARVFWNTPALPILFVLSGLLVGVAGDLLMLSIWPYSFNESVLSFSLEYGVLAAQAVLGMLMAVLIVLNLVAVFIYVLMMYFSASAGARKAASRWLKGSYKLGFWGGLVIVGLVLPLVLIGIGGISALLGAAGCVIVGGVCLRFLIVYCDDRRELKGEALHEKRLPDGSELFLTRNW